MDKFAVAGEQYLKNRNGVFYVEMRVPSHLVNEIGKTHFRESLRSRYIHCRSLFQRRFGRIEQSLGARFWGVQQDRKHT
jgi:hypothetical protein